MSHFRINLCNTPKQIGEKEAVPSGLVKGFKRDKALVGLPPSMSLLPCKERILILKYCLSSCERQEAVSSGKPANNTQPPVFEKCSPGAPCMLMSD